jgi:hypothetical protein
MTNTLLIESQDRIDARDGGACCRMAKALAQHGDAVTVFMVQNGVLQLRAGAHAPGLAALRELGVAVMADHFSLRERGISPQSLAPGVAACALDLVIDRLADGWRVVWH